MSNPVRILIDEFGYTHNSIRQVSYHKARNDTIRGWYYSTRLPPKLHSVLRPVSMVEWGEALRERRQREARDRLFRCYFPRPHIYHLLIYPAMFPKKRIAREADISISTLDSILSRPRISQDHLRRIARFAMKVRDDMSSHKRSQGVDPLYVNIDRALRDQKTIY